MPSSEYNDTTTHYSFNKPHTDAPVNIEDLNANMDTLDSTLYSVETKANASKTITDKITMSDSRYKINSGVTSSDQSSMWKDFGGKDGYCGIRAVRGNSTMAWLPSAYGSGLMVGVQDTMFYVAGNHNASSSTPTVSFAGGTTSNVTNSDPNWYFKIKGANGGEYDLSKLVPNSYDGDNFKALLNASNVDLSGTIAGYIKRYAGVVTLYLSLPLVNKSAYTNELIMTLPTGYLPPASMYFLGYITVSGQYVPVHLQLITSGAYARELHLWTPTGTTLPTSPRLIASLTYVQ